jgi:HNH endonuclease
VRSPNFVTCDWCGWAFRRIPSAVKARNYCSRVCSGAAHRGAQHPNWKGGVVYANGRALVYAPTHPRADTRGYVYRSRIVAETMEGRELLPEEVVHHRDGDPSNDDPSNLEVLPNHAAHMRLHYSLNGRWSRDHDACVECGTVERPHNARGLCGRCYARARAAQPLAIVTPLPLTSEHDEAA